MFERPPSGPEWRSWLWLGLGAVAVYATVPLARWIEATVVAHASRDAFLVAVLVALAGAAGTAIAAVGRGRSARPRPVRIAWLVGVAAAYAAMSFSLRRNAEEAIHFVEYGALGILAFRALGHRSRDASIYPTAALVGATLGMVDELVQWMVPRRVWDLRDVGLNAIGASGVQLALAFGIAPAWVDRRFRRPGLARLCRVGALAVAVLGASLLNTPERIALQARLPGLGFLAQRGTLLEYGHRIEEPDIGVFRSRRAPAALREEDARRGAEAGRILAREGSDDDYEAFLRRYSPLTDPFLHEARVHLFRRDRYLQTGDRHAAEGDLRRARRDWTVAWRENLILERYFGATLRGAGLALAPERRRAIARAQLADRPYESAVSRGLITRVSEAQVLTALGGLWLALVAGAVALGRGTGAPLRPRGPSGSRRSRPDRRSR